MDVTVATWALVGATILLALISVPSAFVALHQAREARAASREAKAARAEAEAAAEAARATVEAAQTADEVRMYAVDRMYAIEENGAPARHHVVFNDGNSRPALDPHDRRSLPPARLYDPVVLSDDPTLGQTFALGFGGISAVAFGGACAAVTIGCALALVTDAVHSGASQFLLIVVALAAVVPTARILPSRLLHHADAIAIGSTGVTVHRRGRELHLAWVEIRKVKVTATSRRGPQAQILLAPATPGGFDTFKGSRLLPKVTRTDDELLVTAQVTFSHSVPMQGRRQSRETATLIAVVDAVLERFAGDKHIPSGDRIVHDEK